MSNPIWSALEDRVRRRPADPVVTFLDSAGQRSELSAKTLANNAAKAANGLRDEGFVEAGSRLSLHLPWHWQRSVWTLAAWLVDAIVVPDGAPGDCDLVIAGPDEAPAVVNGRFGPCGSSDVWVVSVHPFGLPNAAVPEGCLDAATIARTQPDSFTPDPFAPGPFARGQLSPDAGPGGRTALVLGGSASFGQDALLERAAALGAARSFAPGSRFAVVGAPADELAAWLLPALVPLACDASVVMAAAGLDADGISRAESAQLIG